MLLPIFYVLTSVVRASFILVFICGNGPTPKQDSVLYFYCHYCFPVLNNIFFRFRLKFYLTLYFLLHVLNQHVFYIMLPYNVCCQCVTEKIYRTNCFSKQGFTRNEIHFDILGNYAFSNKIVRKKTVICWDLPSQVVIEARSFNKETVLRYNNTKQTTCPVVAQVMWHLVHSSFKLIYLFIFPYCKINFASK